MESQYYKYIRKEILPLLPERMERILEIGCGEGATLSWLKENRLCDWAAGVELSPEAAGVAEKNLNMVIQGNIEQVSMPFKENSMDVILCLDVLEHLIDPWGVVKRLHRLLKPGGFLVASIPNVRYFRVVLPLVIQARWEYVVEGVLDRTHLRFFTKKSALKLIESSGLKVNKVLSRGMEKGRKGRVVNVLTLGLFHDFLCHQYLIRGVRID